MKLKQFKSLNVQMVEGFAVIEATAVENNSAKASHTLTGRGLPGASRGRDGSSDFK